MSYSSNSRVRHFDIIFYAGRKKLLELLELYAPRIAHFAFAEHTKDVYEEDLEENGELKHRKGELKKAHIHLLLDLYNAATCNAVKRLFTTEEDKPRVMPVNDIQAVYEYLWHKNNPEKYQYSKAIVLTDSTDYYERLCIAGAKKDSDNVAENIINDILAGVSPRIMVSRYGRDYCIHMNQYNDVVDKIKQYELENRYRKAKDVPSYKYEQMYLEDKLPFDE